MTAKEKAALKIVDSPVDAETRVHDDHHQSLRLWLRLLTCTNQIESRHPPESASRGSRPPCRASISWRSWSAPRRG